MLSLPCKEDETSSKHRLVGEYLFTAKNAAASILCSDDALVLQSCGLCAFGTESENRAKLASYTTSGAGGFCHHLGCQDKRSQSFDRSRGDSSEIRVGRPSMDDKAFQEIGQSANVYRARTDHSLWAAALRPKALAGLLTLTRPVPRSSLQDDKPLRNTSICLAALLGGAERDNQSSGWRVPGRPDLGSRKTWTDRAPNSVGSRPLSRARAARRARHGEVGRVGDRGGSPQSCT